MNSTNSGAVFLDRNLSVYLDLARFVAALAVLIGHMGQLGLYPEGGFFSGYAHSAVVYFFVLSGLVIAHSTAKGHGWKSYVSARAARIYSVAIPAVIISFLLKGFVYFSIGDFSDYISQDVNWLNFIGPLLFLNESWGLGATVPWNGPYWSLCYEVWYYIVFGFFVHYKGPLRIIVLGMICLIAGPAILLLFPIWLLGVHLSSVKNCCTWGRVKLMLTFFGSIFLMLTIVKSGADQALKDYLHNNIPGFWRLGYSQRFVTDYVLALCVVANIFSARFLMGGAQFFSDRLTKYVSSYASMTFSLYIFHFPLLYVFKSMNLDGIDNEFSSLPIIGVVVFFCWVLSLFTEKKSVGLRVWFESVVFGFIKR